MLSRLLMILAACAFCIALPRPIYAQTDHTPLVCLCIVDIEAGTDQCAEIASRHCGFSDGVLRPVVVGDPAPDPVCLPPSLLNRCEAVLDNLPICGSIGGDGGTQVAQAFLCSGVAQ